MKEVIGIYELKVWSDGTITTTLQKSNVNQVKDEKENMNAVQKRQASSRITQILQVIEISLEAISDESDLDEKTVKRLVTKAVKSVADSFDVFETTIRDKINRQIDLNQQQFVDYLLKYHTSKGQNEELYQHIQKYLSNRTYDEDKELIEKSFSRFKQAYL